MTTPATKHATEREDTEEGAGSTKQKGGRARSRNGVHKSATTVVNPPAAVPETVQRNGVAPDSAPAESQKAVAIFCHEGPGSLIGQYASRLAAALGRRQTAVHLFTREPFPLEAANVTVHAVGVGNAEGFVDQVQEFNSRACNAFSRQLPNGRATLLGFEWSSVPALSLLQATRDLDTVLALTSLERQRSDMQNDISRQIDEIECLGLRQARKVWTYHPAVVDSARTLVPECSGRLTPANLPFPAHEFQTELDPGRIKERYEIAPLDPLVLSIGDMDERHGPDVLMKSVPAVLRNHSQARFVFVGEGTLFWPLRVHARYLLLEPYVRLLGHLEGRSLQDLIQAADVIVAPSRVSTEWWQVQAAWAAGKPVVAGHALGESLGLRHEQDAVLVYPHESSCVWGVERLLHDWDFARNLGANGRMQLEERFGWGGVAAQFEQLIEQPQLS